MGMGCVIFEEGKPKPVFEFSDMIAPGKKGYKRTSNNVSEYLALIAGFKWFLDKGLNKERIEIKGDSKMVVMQMQFKWKCKGGIYEKVYREALMLRVNFTDLKIEWIPRDLNAYADKLSKSHLLKSGVEFRIQKPDKEPRGRTRSRRIFLK